ncbi:hypothetical protein HYE23_03775 [Mycoplasmopsis bovis]|nr:hypothetical protein [Mycoplasmopsis bovis]QQH23985.1 hypothetical protein HYE23_03775 [Mycoplasmopsis bovis]
MVHGTNNKRCRNLIYQQGAGTNTMDLRCRILYSSIQGAGTNLIQVQELTHNQGAWN